METIKSCKFCGEILPENGLYVLHKIAIRRGFCQWPCLIQALRPETVDKLLQDRQNKINKKEGKRMFDNDFLEQASKKATMQKKYLRRPKLKERKKKEPATVKSTSSLRKADAKRFLHSKGIDLQSPEAKIIMEFLETYPSTNTTIAGLEMLLFFLSWLKSKKIHLVDNHTVFCFPFSRLIKLGDLK